jgi:hypothetical protein
MQKKKKKSNLGKERLLPRSYSTDKG